MGHRRQRESARPNRPMHSTDSSNGLRARCAAPAQGMARLAAPLPDRRPVADEHADDGRLPGERFDVVRLDLEGWKGLTRLVEEWIVGGAGLGRRPRHRSTPRGFMPS